MRTALANRSIHTLYATLAPLFQPVKHSVKSDFLLGPEKRAALHTHGSEIWVVVVLEIRLGLNGMSMEGMKKRRHDPEQ